MDRIAVDRIAQVITGRITRRGAGGMGLVAIASALHASSVADAKRKKKKRKKKRPASCTGCQGNEKCQNGQCVDPSCGPCPVGQQCIYGICQDPTCSRMVQGVDCALGQTCCRVEGASTEAVCTVLTYIIPPEQHCCLPAGATYTGWPTRSACCEANNDSVPSSNLERCCIFNGHPDQGHPTFCCDRSGNASGQSVNGHCCEASGRRCNSPDLCCNGQGCPASGICP